uniref:Uncharacterized protein n=1 Tax=Myotis myotis TaxID=51298 RepID=A0A7J7U5E8_MYOMY|nr:hypothetical protein mMyoMyo1_008891 [Myotis myotis]
MAAWSEPTRSTLLGPRGFRASTCRGNLATHSGPASGQVSKGGLAFHRRSIKYQPVRSLTSEGTRRCGVLCRNEGTRNHGLAVDMLGLETKVSLAWCWAFLPIYCRPSWPLSSASPGIWASPAPRGLCKDHPSSRCICQHLPAMNWAQEGRSVSSPAQRRRDRHFRHLRTTHRTQRPVFLICNMKTMRRPCKGC